MVAAIRSNFLEARAISAIVSVSTVSLGFGIAATATPHWHVTDSAAQHVRRGLFQWCAVESVNGVASYNCAAHDYTPFCGHSYDDTRNRFVWPAVLAVLSLVTLALIPVGATASWCFFAPRPGTLLAIAMTSLALMMIGVSIFIATIDGWYFCGVEFCEYAKAQLLNSGDGLCLSGLGYSFILAMIFLGGVAVVAVICALYGRWLRTGAIIDPSLADAPNDEAAGDEDLPVAAGATEVIRAEKHAPLAADDAQDWVEDPQTGLLWSDHHKLFLNPADGRFYDPATDSWYFPDTDQWIPASR